MYTTLRLRPYLTLVLVLCLLPLCLAQSQSSQSPVPSKSVAPAASPTPIPNGISVGRPKVFDNRSLTLMLESLNESLRTSQTSFINQQALVTALGYIQGFRSSESVSNLQFSTLPIPGVKVENIANTGNATATGSPLPDSTKVTTTTTKDAVAPAAPSLDSLPAFSGFTPSYGENAADLLSDQVNLTYQIFNLRMLLERSLSDRIWEDSTRRQAVLGFNVTLDPPRTAEDSVAVVEVTLDACASGNTKSVCENGGCSGACNMDGLSLVSLMPQEKTYNAASLSTKSHAFGGAAVAKVFQVGYSQRQRNQVFYLYRDTDTLSYERMDPEHPNQIIFGWMFRPVLGRRSISPGMRQLFSIVAMPATDKADDKTQNPQDISQWLNATVKTYWKKYDRDTQTSFENQDANRSSRLKYALSFNWLKPEIFDSRYTNRARYTNIEVKPTYKYQDDLKPGVNAISWTPTGPRSIVMSVSGTNFFSGTQVTLGDKAYASSADGLILKSNQAFDLTTTIDALANGPGAIIGRYGLAVPLIQPLSSGGIEISNATLGPSLSGMRELEIELHGIGNKQIWLNNLPNDQNNRRMTPIVTFNGNIVPPPYRLYEKQLQTTAGMMTYLGLQVSVPDSFVPNGGGGVVKVTWPFLPDAWTATTRFYDPDSAYQILRLGANRIVLKASDYLGFTYRPDVSPDGATQPCWSLLVGDKIFKLPSSTCAGDPPPAPGNADGAAKPPAKGENKKKKGSAQVAPEKPPDQVTSYSDFAVLLSLSDAIPDKVILVAPYKATFTLDVPKAGPADPAGPKAIELKQNDAVWVDVAVDDNSKVGSVEANKVNLSWRKPSPDKDHKTIQVQITQELSGKASEMDLTVLDRDGHFFAKAHLRIACNQNCSNGGKQ